MNRSRYLFFSSRFRPTEEVWEVSRPIAHNIWTDRLTDDPARELSKSNGVPGKQISANIYGHSC